MDSNHQFSQRLFEREKSFQTHQFLGDDLKKQDKKLINSLTATHLKSTECVVKTEESEDETRPENRSNK